MLPVVQVGVSDWLRSRSTSSMASAAHTRPNPIHRTSGTDSLKMSTPHRSCSTGVRYCSSPSIVSGIRRAATPNSTSGTAVITPDIASNAAWPGPSLPIVMLPCDSSTTKPMAATGNITIVSRHSDCTAGRFTVFFMNPYVVNEPASARAIHGGRPYPTISTTTATAPSTTAASWSDLTCSFSTTTPSATVTSGVMK